MVFLLEEPLTQPSPAGRGLFLLPLPRLRERAGVRAYFFSLSR
jgi:hypothetical protein